MGKDGKSRVSLRLGLRNILISALLVWSLFRVGFFILEHLPPHEKKKLLAIWNPLSQGFGNAFGILKDAAAAVQPPLAELAERTGLSGVAHSVGQHLSTFKDEILKSPQTLSLLEMLFVAGALGALALVTFFVN